MLLISAIDYMHGSNLNTTKPTLAAEPGMPRPGRWQWPWLPLAATAWCPTDLKPATVMVTIVVASNGDSVPGSDSDFET
jgi:hypothetical protein